VCACVCVCVCVKCEVFAPSSVSVFIVFVLQGMVALRKHADRILILVETMAEGGTLSCFLRAADVVRALRDRLCVSMPDDQLMARVEGMVNESMASLGTRLYDQIQYVTNGIV
jgi:phosphatidylinositol 4-kinase B